MKKDSKKENINNGKNVENNKENTKKEKHTEISKKDNNKDADMKTNTKDNNKDEGMKLNKKTIKEEENIEPNKKSRKIYLSYTCRIVLYIISIIILLGIISYFLVNSFSYNEENKINFSLKGNSNYLVYLKENDFYQDKYLESGMNYVSSLIDYIDTTFVYKINVTDNIDMDFKYKIMARLNIYNDSNNQIYYKNDYVLLKEEKSSLLNNKEFEIVKNVKIDYNKYNDIANNFKTSYGVPSKAELVVYMDLDGSITDSDYKIDNKRLSITIPLSQKSVNISIDKDKASLDKEIVEASSITFAKRSYLFIAIVLLIVTIFLIYKVTRLILLGIPKRSIYDKYINKLLLGYDRVIVKTKYLPDLSELKVIKIEEFQELLDVRDNIKKPIMYYNITSHQKCYFYILEGNNIYLLLIKASDLEKK